MAIIRWDPFREMTQVQNQLNRLVDQVWGGRQESWLPAVDVFDTQEAVVLKAELAGMDPDEIEIEVEDNVLTIKGKRKFEEQVEDERYYRVERRFGSFQRSLALPQGVKADEIGAAYDDGILTVTVPKAEETKPCDEDRERSRRRDQSHDPEPRRGAGHPGGGDDPGLDPIREMAGQRRDDHLDHRHRDEDDPCGLGVESTVVLEVEAHQEPDREYDRVVDHGRDV